MLRSNTKQSSDIKDLILFNFAASQTNDEEADWTQRFRLQRLTCQSRRVNGRANGTDRSNGNERETGGTMLQDSEAAKPGDSRAGWWTK